jgi:hypothetical protein
VRDVRLWTAGSIPIRVARPGHAASGGGETTAAGIASLEDHIRRVTRNAHLWLPGYVRSRLSELGRVKARHVWVVLADHFEPLWQRPSSEVASARVRTWREKWPEVAARHRDSDGRHPRYTFFYPEEEYRPELLEPLAELARETSADVEVHIHHDGDSAGEFCDRMRRFLERLHDGHGLLRRHEGRLVFGFIHGNWALDNSRPDGRWCGLNNELTLLNELGCYADFTLPSAPSPCQTGPVNVIYRATDEPDRPRSHRRGVPVVPGGPATGHLTLIPGPLGLLWDVSRRLLPRVDTGEITGTFPSSPARVRSWLSVAPRITDHSFVKLYTHGAQERNSGPLLGGVLDRLFENLRRECENAGMALHFVTAWEMWRVVESLRRGTEALDVIHEPERSRRGESTTRLANATPTPIGTS